MSNLLLTYHSPAEPSQKLTFATMSLFAWATLATSAGMLLAITGIGQAMDGRLRDLAWLLVLPVGSVLLVVGLHVGWAGNAIYLRHLGAAKSALVDVRAAERMWYVGYSMIGCLAALAAVMEAEDVNLVLLAMLALHGMFHGGLAALGRMLHRAAHDPFALALRDEPLRGSGEVMGMATTSFSSRVNEYLRNARK